RFGIRAAMRRDDPADTRSRLERTHSDPPEPPGSVSRSLRPHDDTGRTRASVCRAAEPMRQPLQTDAPVRDDAAFPSATFDHAHAPNPAADKHPVPTVRRCAARRPCPTLFRMSLSAQAHGPTPFYW